VSRSKGCSRGTVSLLSRLALGLMNSTSACLTIRSAGPPGTQPSPFFSWNRVASGGRSLLEIVLGPRLPRSRDTMNPVAMGTRGAQWDVEDPPS